MSLQELTDQDFSQVLATSEVPVVVDFWAEWCGPCRKVSPILEDLAKEFRDKVKIVKVNVDEAVETSLSQHVLGLPTIAIFKNGERVADLTGAQSKSKIKELIENQL